MPQYGAAAWAGAARTRAASAEASARTRSRNGVRIMVASCGLCHRCGDMHGRIRRHAALNHGEGVPMKNEPKGRPSPLLQKTAADANQYQPTGCSSGAMGYAT